MNRILIKILFFPLLFLLAGKAEAQTSVDTLTFKRHIFTTTVFLKGHPQSNSLLKFTYNERGMDESLKQLKKSKIMLPVGGVITAAGIGLGVDALIGEKNEAIINGKEYVYYKRPIFQLLGGLGLMAAGISIMEFGNDAKIKSVMIHNEKLKDFKFSLTLKPSAEVGINFGF